MYRKAKCQQSSQFSEEVQLDIQTLKTCCKSTTVLTVVWAQGKVNKLVEQKNESRNRSTDAQMEITFHRGSIVTTGGRMSCFRIGGKQPSIELGRKWDICCTLYMKINFRFIKILTVKKQNFTTFRRKIRESFYDFGVGKNFFK